MLYFKYKYVIKEGILIIKDIIYNSDILDGLFTQKDFDFLKENNNRQEEFEYSIKVADLKRDKIIEYIKTLDIDDETLKNIDKDELQRNVNIASIAFESINSIIKNLTNLLNEFNEIVKEILELVVKKESNNNIDVKSAVNNIDDKIFNFKNKKIQIEAENEKYNLVVHNFFNKIQNSDFSKFDTVIEPTSDVHKKTLNSKSKPRDIEWTNNLILRASEKKRKVYLPYTKQEVLYLLENYPNEYRDARDVIEQEFIADISIYNKHPVLARFREAYSLSRNKEMKSAIDSLKFALDMMFRSDLNPTIIAAVKSQKQLEEYVKCLESNKLDNFKYFKIIFEVNPI